MKILLNGYYNFLPKKSATFSGPRNLLGNFLEYLDKSKHDYTAMVLRGKKQNDAKFRVRRIPTKKKSSWMVVTLRLNTKDIFEATSARIPDSTKQPIGIITELVRKENPDVIFLNGISVTNWYLLKAAMALRIPVIVNHLGLWFKEVIEYGGTKHGISMMIDMERDMVRHSEKNIFLSKLSYRHLNKHLIKVPRSKQVFIPNPIDPVFVHKSIPPKRKKPYKIGIVARWDPIKNHAAVLNLALEAKKQNLPVEFHSVTTIHKKYKWGRDIKKAYAKNVVIHGPKDPKGLAAFYREMDLLILPSNFDVSPTVVMEAIMQDRMTAISENVGLIDVYRENGASEFIIDFKDAKKALAKIEKLIGKTPNKKLKNYIKSNYNVSTVMNRYIKLAESLIR